MSDQGVLGGVDLPAELERIAGVARSIGPLTEPEQRDALRAGAVQELLASAIRLYVGCLELDPSLPAFPGGSEAPSATDALMAVTAILNAVQIEPFELGLWATWGFTGADERGEEAK
jgi:hypothetical protein